MRLTDLAERVGGVLVGADLGFGSVAIDTRTLQSGDLYVAIIGDRFDGNDFVAAAQRKGACAAVVSRPVAADLPQVVVADTTVALGILGTMNRERSPAVMVGVTGSQGKTTVKEMTGRILQLAGETLVTRGNLNNAIGVPLTLLELDAKHRYGVIEMGANHAGEIAYSVGLVKPDVVVLTNAARAHIEGFGSLAGVADAKGEIIDGVALGGTVVLNRDDRFYDRWRQRAGNRRTVSFSLSDPGADYFARSITRQPSGRFAFCLAVGGKACTVTLNLLGKHNIRNALAAAAAGAEAGASLEQIQQGLQEIRPVRGRMCLRDGLNRARIIDDSYNASPDSFRAAIETLAEFDGRRILLMGDMAELGNTTEESHRELGRFAAEVGIEDLWTIGEASRASAAAFGPSACHFADKQSMVARCLAVSGPGVTFLVKGSRRAGMDEVADALEARPPSGQ